MITPAILPKTKAELLEKLAELPASVRRVQIDVCDGVFVPSKTWPIIEGRNLFDQGDLVEDDQKLQKALGVFIIELDLMVKNADHFCPLWESFHPDHVIFHLDSLENSEWLATQFALSYNAFSWLRPERTIFACSLTTDIEKFNYWYHYFGCRKIQVMGINHIGKQGQSFDPEAVTYIKTLRARYADLEIQVDGGMNLESIPQVMRAGAEGFICGSSVFEGDVSENIAKLESLLQ